VTQVPATGTPAGGRRAFAGFILAAWTALLPSGCSRAPPSAASAEGFLLAIGSRGTSPGKLYKPRALALDAKTRSLFVVDRSGRIQQFDLEGRHLRQWRLPEYEQGQPVGIAVEKDGSLLVSDSHYHRVLRFSPDGERITHSWGSEGTGPGQFTFGRDVVVDSEGAVYVGDYGGLNDRIQKFSPDGSFLLEWGRPGEAPGEFQRPQGMAVERRGAEESILVADCANHRVQRFTTGGKWLWSFGALGTGPGEMRFPFSVAVDEGGDIYVCEWGNHRIQRFDPEGRSLGTLGRGGHGEGELYNPWDIAVGPDGRLYVADCENHRIQVFRREALLAARHGNAEASR
jgi:DNA-binding beta-propeller fold protein YncE